MIEVECVKLLEEIGIEIVVYLFENFLIDCVKDVGVQIIVWGFWVVIDFEYEYQMVGMNCVLDDSIEMVFLMVDLKYQVIVLKLVKEIVCLGGDISKFVILVVNDVVKEWML